MPDRLRDFTAQNCYISQFYHHAARQGLDADAMLREAEIPRELIDDPRLRVEVGKLASFIIAMCDALQDESMGFTASAVPRGSFYMMGKLTIHEPSLGKALVQMQRFFGLVTRSFTLRLVEDGEVARLDFDLQESGLDDNHLFAEMNLMMFHRYSSWLIAENIPLIDVWFSYAPPPQVREYGFLFPGRHLFNAESTGFSFPRRFLDAATVQNPGTLKTFMRRCPMELFMRPRTDFSFTREVYQLLSRQLKNQVSTLEDVAGILQLTPRTLLRRLKNEGSSFQAVKDMVRRDKAIYYLTSQGASVSDISERLGFSDASVFTRAFRSWTGVSPGRYRSNYLRQLRAGGMVRG